MSISVPLNQAFSIVSITADHESHWGFITSFLQEERASFKIEKQKSWKNIFSRQNSKSEKKDDKDDKLSRKGSTKSTST